MRLDWQNKQQENKMISKPYKAGEIWAVSITRKNGQTYRVTSDDYQAIVDYRAFFLSQQKQKER